MTVAYAAEGKVPVEGGDVWYGIAGGGEGVPLVTLHGGPGGGSCTVEPLADLADERPVVLYDQLGCGRSDRPSNRGLWRRERFVAELHQLVEHLGYEQVHLMGASWGTMLAVDFVLSHPEAVAGLVLSNPCLSVTRWMEDCDRLIAAMGGDFHRIFESPDASAQELARLNQELFERHFWRVNRSPEVLAQAERDFGREVFETMWGPNDFTCTGTLANYERVVDLAAIRSPTLFACGRFDEATPESTQLYAAQVSDSQMVIFENSAHMPMFEERHSYIETLRTFLQNVDARTTR